MIKIAVFALVLVTAVANAQDDLLNVLSDDPQKIEATATPKYQAEALKIRSALGYKPSQNLAFLDSYAKGEFGLALAQYYSSEKNRDLFFEATLVFRAGFPLVALESLARLDASKMPAEIADIWKQNFRLASRGWNSQASFWKPGWAGIFGRRAEVASILGLTSQSASDLKLQVGETQNLEAAELADLKWRLALQLADDDNAVESAKALAEMLRSKNLPVSSDLINLTIARLLYQNKYLDPALGYYQKVSKKSSYWAEAQEEMAWTYLRKNQFQDSLAITKSLVIAPVSHLVGPEAYLVRGMSYLRVCDYQNVLRALIGFREQFRPRTETLLKVSEMVGTSEFIAWLNSSALKSEDLKFAQWNPRLPRFSNEDQTLRSQFWLLHGLLNESERLDQLRKKSVNIAEVGEVAEVGELAIALQKRISSVRSNFQERLKVLAKGEVEEISQVLSKMHILEAEVLQQLSKVRGVQLAGKADIMKSGIKTESKDSIWFKADEEVWLDELANYRVDIERACGRIKR